MPRRDGTGPMGAGSMTGRGLGLCTGDNAVMREVGLGTGSGMESGMGSGLGLACRRGFGRNDGHGFSRGVGQGAGRGIGRGFGRGFAVNKTSSEAQKELLNEQRTILQNRLEVIDKQLESL